MVKEEIQYVTDGHGARIFVQIPLMTWERIQIELGWKDEEQDDEESAELIDKQGILVVRATPLADLSNTTKKERHRRTRELIRRTGL